MLILSRKIGGEIVIGDKIRLKVISIGTGKIRVGITAPKGVQITRAELLSSIQQQAVLDAAEEQNARDLAELQRGKPHTF